MPAEAPTIEDIRAARDRIKGDVLRTPLVPLVPLDHAPAGARIHLKLENLQPIGSFKLRGASNAMRLADPAALADGVWTASAGNMAQGVAWQARRLGLPCTVVAPDHAPETKRAAVERLGARIVLTPFAEWFELLTRRTFPGVEGLFIHPVSDRPVMAGNGTIGLELLEDLPDVDAVIIPYGGGGLTCGIASAIRALRPATRIYACEVDTAAPLAQSLAAGERRPFEYKASFVDGMGSPFLLEDMWPLVRALVDGSIVVTLEEIASAIRLLAERHRVIAEGAGAASVAAALTGRAGTGNIACIVSGGNLDSAKLSKILAGTIP
ncbi:MAG: threonine ammonia-lyase [Candidatus Eiseniibacteriota bacterium]